MWHTSSWQAPVVGWIKINVNGAVSAQGGAVTGGILKDEREQWLYGFSRSLDSCYVLNAELWALHDSIDHVWRLDYPRVEIETDNPKVSKLANHTSEALVGYCYS
ncbi:hypothetical protein GQ457_16G003820 [Hibiscus cannabinus]